METEQMFQIIITKLDNIQTDVSKLQADVSKLQIDVKELQASNEVIKAQTAQLTEFKTEMIQFKIETGEKLDQILEEMEFLRSKNYQFEKDIFNLKTVLRLTR